MLYATTLSFVLIIEINQTNVAITLQKIVDSSNDPIE